MSRHVKTDECNQQKFTVLSGVHGGCKWCGKGGGPRSLISMRYSGGKWAISGERRLHLISPASATLAAPGGNARADRPFARNSVSPLYSLYGILIQAHLIGLAINCKVNGVALVLVSSWFHNVLRKGGWKEWAHYHTGHVFLSLVRFEWLNCPVCVLILS